MDAEEVKPEHLALAQDGCHFTCSGYSTERLQGMLTMQRKGKLCDVVVSVRGEEFRGHKLVLASASRYFSDLFGMEMDVSKNSFPANSEGGTELYKHKFDDIAPEAFRSLLGFFYTGEILITLAILEDLMAASKMFKIDSLAKACCDSMPKLLNPETWHQIRRLADKQGYVEFLKICHKFSRKHFEEIVHSESFLQLSLGELKDMLSQDDLSVSSEETVYSAILKWVKHDTHKRLEHLSELMVYINLQLLDKSFFTRNVAREPLMRENSKCYDLVLQATDHHMGVECEEKVSINAPRRHYREHLPYIFVAGGVCSDKVVNDCEIYDPELNAWRPFPSMRCKRASSALVGFKEMLYAFGGMGNKNTRHLSAEYYNPLLECWTSTTPLPHPIWMSGVCSIDNSIYLCGGSTNETVTNAVLVFDPTTGVYASSTPMNTGRSFFMPAVSDNRIYAIGGFTYDDERALKSMEVLDPREGKWQHGPSMSVGRTNHGVAVSDGCIYVSPTPALLDHNKASWKSVPFIKNWFQGTTWERFNIRRNAWEPIVKTHNKDSPSNGPGCLYLVNTWENFPQFQFDTNTNAVYQLPPMSKIHNLPAITVMNYLKI